MAQAPNAPAAAKVAVTPKAGTKLYHGHGHHHFEAGRTIHLPAAEAERLLADGLAELVPPPAAPGAPPAETPPAETAPAAPVA